MRSNHKVYFVVCGNSLSLHSIFRLIPVSLYVCFTLEIIYFIFKAALSLHLLSGITNCSTKDLMKQRRRNVCPVIKKNEKRRHRVFVIVLYSMRSTLRFSSPFHPLLAPLLHACTVINVRRAPLWMSSWCCGHSFCCHRWQRLLAPFVKNLSTRFTTNYHICRFDGICCMLVCVEGQMKGPTDKGTCDPSYESNYFWKSLFRVIPSDSCWDVEKYRSIQMATNYFVLLNNALFFLKRLLSGSCFYWFSKEGKPLWAIIIICNWSPNAFCFPCFQFVHPKVSVKLTLLMFFLVCVIPKTVFSF